MINADRRDVLIGASVLGVGMLGGGLPAIAAGGSAAPLPTFSDPQLNEPYIDVDEWRDAPSRHRYVHGGFKGTEARFLLLFPDKPRYGGRFYQHNTAIPTSELLAGKIFGDDFAGFCFDSGAIAVVTNQGGFASIAQTSGNTVDPAFGSYRVAAAAAMYVRTLAQQMYGPHRTYGYAFGGSGGGYRTLACAENTDAWEGVVPYIHGNEHAWPNSYSARARAQRTLKAKMPTIADAIEPGGGDMYAALDPGERAILREVTGQGFPYRTWVFNEAMGIGPLTVIFQAIQTLDPDYFSTFWTTPGYLGHDAPQSFAGVRLQHRARIARVVMSDEAAHAGVPAAWRPGQGTNADPDLAWRTFQADYGAPLPVAIELDRAPPEGSFLDMANIDVASGAGAGKWIVLGAMAGKFARFQFSPAGGSLREITEHVRPGDEVVIDNSNILAYETYYRHALLTRDYYVDDELRHADGTPIYPQRPRLIGADLMRGATPTIPTGKFGCKMIVVQNLVDWDAHGWYADYYRTRVRDQLGARIDDQYRLYYTDYATHGSIPDPTRVTSFDGMLQQALRDVAAWVEQGTPPPATTNYRVVDGQVVVADAAADRRGIQPVVDLTANGAVVTHAKVGEPVRFAATIATPPRAGHVVAAEWAFDTGPKVVAQTEGRYTASERFAPAARVQVTRQHAFTKPGTYFPALRAFSQRGGDAATPYARIGNLGRVRVVVT